MQRQGDETTLYISKVMDQSKTVEVRIMEFLPYCSPIPLVFAVYLKLCTSFNFRSNFSDKYQVNTGPSNDRRTPQTAAGHYTV